LFILNKIKPLKIMSYYKTIGGKKMDTAIIAAAEEAVSGSRDGRISKADAGKILKVAKDAGKITAVEQTTLKHIHKNYQWTEASEKWFAEAISKLQKSK
jgi:hypothetical protein